MGERDRPTPAQQPLKELRIALVCYGGVSLAIYMHGLTKELLKLARAARAFDVAYRDDPALRGSVTYAGVVTASRHDTRADTDTEVAYFDALVSLARGGHPLSVNIDVISGTSAGGISGITLAHALAHDRSLESFRDVWLKQGDIKRLVLRNPFVGVDDDHHWGDAVKSALHRLASQDLASTTPLNGDLMCRLVYNALEKMGPAQDPLVPPDASLELFVTTTDVYGFNSPIPDGAGELAHSDLSYRQVLAFKLGRRDARTEAPASPYGADTGNDASDDFSDDDIGALGFAARATSSFPGAFPSVSVNSYVDAIRAERHEATRIEPASITAKFFYGEDFGVDPAATWYMDGGVLDNGPFDLTINAIAAKRATGLTARELVFIEPDPGPPPELVNDKPKEPSTVRVITNARNTIPRRQVFVEALSGLRDMNSAIATVGAIATQEMDQVKKFIDELDLDISSDYDAVFDQSAKVRELAQDRAGLTYGTYCRLRAESIALEVGPALGAKLGYAPGSNRASFVTAVVSAWMREQAMWLAADPAELETHLGELDVPIRRRRAQFMLQGINGLLAHPGTEDARELLVRLKTILWDMLELLRRKHDEMAEAAVAGARGTLGPEHLSEQAALSDPRAFAVANTTALQAVYGSYKDAAIAGTRLQGSSRQLWELLKKPDSGPVMPERAELRTRYLMYPVWDALIFPVIELSKLPQLLPIKVRRSAPTTHGGCPCREASSTSCRGGRSRTSAASSKRTGVRTTISGVGSTESSSSPSSSPTMPRPQPGTSTAHCEPGCWPYSVPSRARSTRSARRSTSSE